MNASTSCSICHLPMRKGKSVSGLQSWLHSSPWNHVAQISFFSMPMIANALVLRLLVLEFGPVGLIFFGVQVSDPPPPPIFWFCMKLTHSWALFGGIQFWEDGIFCPELTWVDLPATLPSNRSFSELKPLESWFSSCVVTTCVGAQWWLDFFVASVLYCGGALLGWATK